MHSNVDILSNNWLEFIGLYILKTNAETVMVE